MQRVAIYPAGYDNCRKAVDRVFDLFALELSDKTVLIKPNVLRESQPEDGIATHPAVLQAVVERVSESRPDAIIVGDNPGAFSYGANEASFRSTGLMEAAKGYYRNIGTDPVDVPFNAAFAERIRVSREVLDADVIISLPKFKTHGLTTVTGAVKNSYGFIPGAQKAKLHLLAGDPWRFGELVVDVFNVRVPDLFIVDAVVGMEGNGPAGKDLRDIGKILASDNAVALDAVIARMMGLDPAVLRFMQVAHERGHGDHNPTATEIIGELQTIPEFKLPPLAVTADDIAPEIKSMLTSRTQLRPVVDDALCTGCGTCIDQCPAEALAMEEDVPVVDPDKCITCFCCQEICPETAIQLS